MNESKYVLGLNGNYFHKSSARHNTSACLLKDGKIIAAVSEERLTRKKGDGSYPFRSIKEVLRIGGINMDDISYVAYSGGHPIKVNSNNIKAHISTFIDTKIWPSKSIFNVFKDYLSSFRHLRSSKFEFENVQKPLYLIDHHLSHAASAYYTAPFEKSLVLTIDGGGDGLDGSVYYGDKGVLKKMFTIPSFQSPCTMYSGLTYDLGFKRLRHEGKLTGLAAYGSAALVSPKKKQIISYSIKKKRFISKQIAKHHKDLNSLSPYYGGLINSIKKEDLAAHLQQTFEKVILDFVSHAYDFASSKGYEIENVSLAGGAFANVRLNQKIFELGMFKDLYVFPAMGDDGLSVGAALHAYQSKEKGADKKDAVIEAPFFGAQYDREEIKRVLDSYDLKYNELKNINEKVGELLANSKVVARVQGSMEFGPRSLGNRSLIASPFDKSINDWLNNQLNRTEFMPFAPSILAEKAGDYFSDLPEHGVTAADHMTITCKVKPEMQQKIPAVVHVDGTARPQMVKKEFAPQYHDVIKSFEKHTGIPLILNTSFNMHEEPIVNTPDEAVKAFLQSKVDYLAIEDFLVEQVKG